TSATASSLNVDVTYGPIPCVPASPIVTLSPPNPSVSAGGAASYSVTVTNNDSLGCASRSFDLSSVQPSGWPAAVFTQAALLIAPAASASTTMTRSVPTGTAAGTYAVDATAQNGGNSGTGLANVTVVPPPPPVTVTLSIPKTTYPTNSTIPITAT